MINNEACSLIPKAVRSVKKSLYSVRRHFEMKTLFAYVFD